jgi:hypothetical protein
MHFACIYIILLIRPSKLTMPLYIHISYFIFTIHYILYSRQTIGGVDTRGGGSAVIVGGGDTP